jgi:hypothetical protein
MVRYALFVQARDGAHRNLGSYIPSVADAHHSLLRVLEEQSIWESRLKQVRESVCAGCGAGLAVGVFPWLLCLPAHAAAGAAALEAAGSPTQ